MHKEELETILKDHELWLVGNGGNKANLQDANLWGANLRGADLRGANLRGADLRDASLRDANLWGASLRDANLRGADLRDVNLWGANLLGANLRDADLLGANLQDANLRGANLQDANLWGAIGNMREVKSLQLETYTVVYTCDRMQIGCRNHSIEEWFNFTDDEISTMDSEALERWNKFKDYIKMTIELSPARSNDNA